MSQNNLNEVHVECDGGGDPRWGGKREISEQARGKGVWRIIFLRSCVIS